MDLRTWTKIVAIVELILSAISLRVLLFYFMFGVTQTVSAAEQIEQNVSTWLMACVFWLPFSLMLLVLFIQFRAAVKLFILAKSRLLPVEHAVLARFWRNITIVFILCAVLHAILGPGNIDGTILLTIVTISVRFFGLVLLYFWIKLESDELSKNILAASAGRKHETGYYDMIYTDFPMELTADGLFKQNMNIEHCQTI